MIWQTLPKFSVLYRSISLCLAGTFGLIASVQAATVGQTVINSTQHEPLSASIAVSNIDVTNFSVSLASNQLYQELGLSPNAALNVRFEPTSQNTGKVHITSSQPISTPFTDVVLTLNDGERQQVVPKTLLMPLSASARPVMTQQLPAARGASAPNLPVVSSEVQLPSMQVGSTLPQAPRASDIPAPPDRAARIDSANASQTVAQAPRATPSSGISGIASSDRQSDVLSIYITRRAPGVAPRTISIAPENIVVEAPTAQPRAEAPMVADSTPKPVPTPTTAASTPRADAATYVVQRNDNLWTIANQLARENNLDVQTVMSEIQAQNPEAFIQGDASRLLANQTLVLPDYEVIPSRLGIQAATQARRQAQASTRTQAATRRTQAAVPARTTRSAAASRTAAALSRSTAATQATRPLPRAQMTLITPGQQGRADGTQTQAAQSRGSGASSELVSTLRATRQQTASSAERVNGLNSQISEYTRTLQVQNQRLADLEARLKALRSQ